MRRPKKVWALLRLFTAQDQKLQTSLKCNSEVQRHHKSDTAFIEVYETRGQRRRALVAVNPRCIEFVFVGPQIPINDSVSCWAIGFQVIKKYERRFFLFLRGKVQFFDNFCLS